MRYLVGLAFVTLAAACGEPDNTLSGSLSRDYSLEFDRVDITKHACVLTINYVRAWPALGPEAEFSTCLITLETDRLSLASGRRVAGSDFDKYVTVQRTGPSPRHFPEIAYGW